MEHRHPRQRVHNRYSRPRSGPSPVAYHGPSARHSPAYPHPVPTLPPVTPPHVHLPLVANASVRRRVSPDGAVVCAVLWSRSGATEADRDALLMAKRLLFDPALSIAAGRQQSANLRFIWVPASGGAPVPPTFPPVPNPP